MARRARFAGRAPAARPKRSALLRAWLAGVLAAALAAALAATLAGWIGSLGRRAADAVAPPATATATPSPAPLTANVQPLGVCGVDWMVPGGPAAVRAAAATPLDASKTWRDWPPAAAGSNAAPHNVLFFAQGRTPAEVIITAVTVKVVERRPLPPSTTLLHSECADNGAFRWLDVDLDSTPPRVIPHYDADAAKGMAGEVPQKQLTPIRFPYEVSISDAEPFLITARAKECDCSWVAEVSWASEGRSGTALVDDGGRPFRTIGANHLAGRCNVSNEATDCREARPGG